MTQSILINLCPNKYSHRFCYYLFAVSLNRCMGSYNTLNDLSNRVYVPNKTKVLNLSAFNVIIGINESIAPTKHISCECKYKVGGKKCNWNQKRKNNKCCCEHKNLKQHCECKK